MSSDPRALIELVDKWRARGFHDCADELEALINAEPRGGTWISVEDLDRAEKRADDKAEHHHHHHEREHFDPEHFDV